MVMRSAAEVLALMDDPDAARRLEGCFLCFLMIPVIERSGQWRFAGAARNLAEAFERIEALLRKLAGEVDEPPSLRALAESSVLDWPTSLEESWSACDIQARGLGAVTFEVLAEGGAPYDDGGFAILAVETLEGHPYASRGVESRRPEAWSEGDYEADLDRAPEEWIED
jgi:hypothetical protein